jgi:hypothetical protein
MRFHTGPESLEGGAGCNASNASPLQRVHPGEQAGEALGEAAFAAASLTRHQQSSTIADLGMDT